MKIVVLDGYAFNPGDIPWDSFKALGDFTLYDRTPAEQTVERIGDAEIVITNKTVMTRETFDACPNVKYVGILATGYNTIDTEVAKERGVVVTNVPAYSTEAVAQFVFALLLEVCHHVGSHAEGVRAGKWTKSVDFCYWDFPLIELYQKTLGLVGYGSIGKAVAKIAVAMGMNVRVFTRTVDKSLETDNIKFALLDEMLAASDIVSLHVPLFPETKGMVNAGMIAKMRDKAILINTARGGLVVDQDVADSLVSGKLFSYAADVATTEPIAADNPLLTAPNCILTPHIAWAPLATRQRLMAIAVGNLAAFLAGKPVNVVNR